MHDRTSMRHNFQLLLRRDSHMETAKIACTRGARGHKQVRADLIGLPGGRCGQVVDENRIRYDACVRAKPKEKTKYDIVSYTLMQLVDENEDKPTGWK